MKVNTDIASVLGSGQGAADGKLLDTLRTISQNLRGGTPADMEALSGADLKNLNANLELAQHPAGGRRRDHQPAAASPPTASQDLQITTAQALSNTQDADLAKVSIAFSNEQAAYNAALHAGASIVQMSLLEFLH